MNDEFIESHKRPKLLIASRVFGASGQPWLWRQVVGFRAFRKHVVCWERKNSETQAVSDASIHILNGSPAPYDGSCRWLYRLRNFPSRNFYSALGRERGELEILLRDHRPNVLLCNFGDIAMRMLPVSRHFGIPVVAYFHGDFCFTSNRWYRWSLNSCLRQFAAVVVVTKAEQQWMLQQGIPNDRVHVIPCGAPTEVFRPKSPRREGAVRFAMVSRLAAEKGCAISIEAFGRVASVIRETELHIYGDGPARQDLERLVRDLGLESRVFFYGYLDEEQVAERLPSHDVFVQHSLSKEGSPVSIVEAMACGLPVIATPVGGIAEQVVSGISGLLVPEKSVSAMAYAMQTLALYPELRMEFGKAARERAVNLYDSSSQTRKLENLLFDVARGGSVRTEKQRG